MTIAQSNLRDLRRAAAPPAASERSAQRRSVAAHPAQSALRPPERPKLAPGIRLAGEMKESAFKRPPWLIERQGSGYVQVTELLYRIAERCDGRHTAAQIAADVAETTGVPINADGVRRLVAGQLLPRGLVETADGQVLSAPHAGSLLALNLRMKMVGAEAIDPFARVLQALYWPPLLVVALLAAAVVEVWLYHVHGVAGSVHDALYVPGLGLAVLGFMVVAAVIHEFGHAAALRYGGGKVRAMGAGLYLVYPALYTDVSDNYRLTRWARVRTDLGGFYFNLLTVLGLMAIYAATGWEVLLLIVLLINLEIVHQLLPFVRFDGYWVLADITGVPDFFSQMGAFLRSVLPLEGWRGRKLPELKWWGKVVFTVYIFVTVPLLALLVFLMLKGTPRILATAWDSFQLQSAAFAHARDGGDGWGIAAAAGQTAALGLPTLALLYTLYRLAKGLVVGIWNWSRPTLARRTVAALGTITTALLVYVLGAPRVPAAVPLAGGRPGSLYNVTGSFEPIRSTERGRLTEVVTGFVANVPAQPTPAARPGADGAPAGEATTGTVQARSTAGAGLDPATAVPGAASPTPNAPGSRAGTQSTQAPPAGQAQGTAPSGGQTGTRPLAGTATPVRPLATATGATRVSGVPGSTGSTSTVAATFVSGPFATSTTAGGSAPAPAS